jgi:hypothetical protein
LSVDVSRRLLRGTIPYPGRDRLQDYHLHRFTIAHPRTKKEQIFGIHNLQQDCDDPLGWATQIASMFTRSNPVARYES